MEGAGNKLNPKNNYLRPKTNSGDVELDEGVEFINIDPNYQTPQKLS